MTCHPLNPPGFSAHKTGRIGDLPTKEEIRHLGSGAFGAAVLVRRLKDGRRLVAKKCSVKDMEEKQRRMCFEEIALLQKVRHECVAQLVDFVWASKDMLSYWIVLKFYPGGDVQSEIDTCRETPTALLRNQLELPIGKVKNWVTQLCMALKHVHKLRIVHRDVKGSNMFISGARNIVLGDFGVSKQLTESEQKAMTSVGSPMYMAPEWWDGRGGTANSDMWSVGVVLFELMALHRPFEAQNVLSLVHKITTEEPAALPEDADPQLSSLAMQLLDKRPERRPSAAEVLQAKGLEDAEKILQIYREALEKKSDRHQRRLAREEDAAAGKRPRRFSRSSSMSSECESSAHLGIMEWHWIRMSVKLILLVTPTEEFAGDVNEVKHDDPVAFLKRLVASTWKVPSMCLEMSIETHVLDDQDVLGKWACNKELEVSALVVSERLYDAIENGRLPERANALAALPQIALPGDGRALEAALHALEQPAPLLQMTALDTLALLGKGNQLVINDIATLLCSICGCDRLREMMVKCHALEKLAQVAPRGEDRALDALLAGITDADETVRNKAKESIPTLVLPGDSMFIARLVAKLSHGDRQVRQTVVEALPLAAGEAGAGSAMRECALLLDHSNWVVRQAALKAVAALSHGQQDCATAIVIPCLQDRDRDIRCQALEILANVAVKGDEQAALSMVACLEDAERDVREAVLRYLPSLARRGCRGLFESVEMYLSHPDVDVRHSAVVLLPHVAEGCSRSSSALTSLLEDGQVRIRCSAVDALLSLSDWSNTTFEALIRALTDPERAVRRAAMKVITA
ncbi:unnamed protein product [Durusdinium trenchii]|uniref:non-specific serine/threonine protein kinase n=1 Tax=Durusdinium trenchii TaxID=1381693 RepID=A0ABP0S8R2_9DINO